MTDNKNYILVIEEDLTVAERDNKKVTIKTLIEEKVYNTIKVNSIDDIKDCKRLFYELHTLKSTFLDNIYTSTNKISHNVFKEIKNIEEFIKEDKKLNDIEYINWHNFKYI